MQELIQAARRGVRVRVLLSDSYVDPSAPKDNAWTAAYMNRVAAQERLDLQVRLMRTDLTRVTTLHNKGVVVDGERVLVSSINWSLNSPALNREVGLILEHPAIGEYYGEILMSATRNTRSPFMIGHATPGYQQSIEYII